MSRKSLKEKMSDELTRSAEVDHELKSTLIVDC